MPIMRSGGEKVSARNRGKFGRNRESPWAKLLRWVSKTKSKANFRRPNRRNSTSSAIVPERDAGCRSAAKAFKTLARRTSDSRYRRLQRHCVALVHERHRLRSFHVTLLDLMNAESRALDQHTDGPIEMAASTNSLPDWR